MPTDLSACLEKINQGFVEVSLDDIIRNIKMSFHFKSILIVFVSQEKISILYQYLGKVTLQFKQDYLQWKKSTIPSSFLPLPSRPPSSSSPLPPSSSLPFPSSLISPHPSSLRLSQSSSVPLSASVLLPKSSVVNTTSTLRPSSLNYLPSSIPPPPLSASPPLPPPTENESLPFSSFPLPSTSPLPPSSNIPLPLPFNSSSLPSFSQKVPPSSSLLPLPTSEKLAQPLTTNNNKSLNLLITANSSLKKFVGLKSKSEISKLKGGKGGKKKKLRKSFLEKNIEENFLITQLLETEEKKKEKIMNKPTFKIFSDIKFIREKILEAIEKVKIEKKWIGLL